MPRPLRKSFEGAKYHITARGNGRQDIFLSEVDRTRFLNQLSDAIEKDGVIVYAYVLMSNHYHLLIETSRANVSAFMQRLNTAYSMYFRYKHDRPGHLLQGRYSAKLVQGDDYLIRLSRYIHLNPVKIQKMQKVSEKDRLEYLRNYKWSSYPVYTGYRSPGWVNLRWRALAGGRTRTEEKKRYQQYVESFVARDDERLCEIIQISPYAIGDEEFVEKTESEFRKEKYQMTVNSDVIAPSDAIISLSRIDELVSSEFNCSSELLKEHGRRAGIVKNVAIEAACRFSGKSQRSVGGHYGLSGAAVARQRRRLSEERNNNLALDRRVKKVLFALQGQT